MSVAAQSPAPYFADWRDRYELVGKIGAGGFAEVYEAYDVTLEEPVALKIVPDGRALNARIVREVEAATTLDHANIVALYDWFAGAVVGIRFRSGLGFSFCCDPTGVVNLKADVGGFETDRWRRYPFDVGIADVVILMAHEARHAEGYPHYCTWVENVGYVDDDDLGSPFGSWSVQYYLELWLADHTSLAFLRGPASAPTFYQDQHRIDASFLASRFQHCLP